MSSSEMSSSSGAEPEVPEKATSSNPMEVTEESPESPPPQDNGNDESTGTMTLEERKAKMAKLREKMVSKLLLKLRV